VIVSVAVLLHPPLVVPVTVYVVVEVGVAVTLAPVVEDSPIAGPHVYVPPAPAPEAVTAMPVPPLQKLPDAGSTAIVGVAQFSVK
jgi:hypothetical protein